MRTYVITVDGNNITINGEKYDISAILSSDFKENIDMHVFCCLADAMHYEVPMIFEDLADALNNQLDYEEDY